MVNDAKQLPNGWTWQTVDDLSKNIQYGYTESANDEPVGPKFLRITDIQDGKVNWDTVPYCVCSDDEAGKYLLESGDIVFARTGATTGKSFLIMNPPKAVFASYLIRLRLQEEINKKYFAYFLDSPDYWSQIMQVRKGSAQPGVNAAILAKLKVPIAPLPEQERIVAKIEELFTQLDAGTSALERVQAGLRRYKASVLKAAVSGKLVNGKSAIGSGNLPEGWQWVRLDQITENFDSKRVPVKASDRESMQGEYPYYGASGIIDYVNDYLFDGDFLLIAEDGANLLSRSTPIAFQAHGKFWVNNHAHIVQAVDGMPLAYLENFLNSLDLQFYVTGTAQPKLTQANLNKILVPLPPLEEQRRIVAEVERRLSVAREVEAAVEAALVRASRLRQAVLKSAFEGRLT